MKIYRTELSFLSWKKKFGPKRHFSSYDFCEQKNNHVGFIKSFVLIMVYKKIRGGKQYTILSQRLLFGLH